MPDYAHYEPAKEAMREQEHQAKLAAWLKANGYPGKYTGEIYRTPRADGSANYMMADGPKSCLIHLPYGDAWDDPNVQYIPKKAIIEYIEKSRKWAKIPDIRLSPGFGGKPV
jgi:hypothetical protein